MSIKNSKIFLIFFMVLGIGIYSSMMPQSPPSKSISGPIFISEYSSQGVVERVIQLKIETTDLKKSTANDSTQVTALVSLPFDHAEQLRYKWTLGQDVILKEGSLEGSTSNRFSKDRIEKIIITVQGFSAENLRHIGFEVWGVRNQRRIYADGLISSQKENSFEDVVQHVEKIKSEKSGVKK